MNLLNFVGSIAVVVAVNLLTAPILNKIRRRDPFSPSAFALPYVIWIFSTVVLMGTVSSVTLWVEALFISVPSGVLILLTHSLLNWTWNGASADRGAQVKVSAALTFLRCRKSDLIGLLGLCSAAYVLLPAVYLFTWFASTQGAPSQSEGRALVLTVFTWTCVILSFLSFLACRRLALQSTTDEGTRTFLLIVWMTTLIPGVVSMLVLRWWEGRPPVVYEVPILSQRSLSIPLVFVLAAVLIVELWVYFAGVGSRRKRMQDILVVEGDLARLLTDYQQYPTKRLRDSVKESFDDALTSAILHTYTPTDVLAAIFRYSSDVPPPITKPQGFNLGQHTGGARHSKQNAELDPDEQALLAEFFANSTPSVPYCDRVALPEGRWRQCLWIFSWMGKHIEAADPIDDKRELEDSEKNAFKDLSDSWKAARARNNEWYERVSWNLLVDEIARLPDISVGLLTSFLAELREQWRTMAAEVPHLKWPARWIFDLYRKSLRRIYRFASSLLSRLKPFLESVVRVVRRMPAHDLEWKHYAKIARARKQFVGARQARPSLDALQSAIEALRKMKDLDEKNPFVKLIIAMVPVIGPVVIAAAEYLIF